MNPNFDGYGDDLRSQARAFDDIAREIERAGNVWLPSIGKGVTVSRAREILVQARQSTDKGVDRLLLVAAVADELKRAAADFRRDAPTLDEIAAAEKALAQAREAMMRAAETGPSSAEEARFRAAQQHLRDLRAKRKAAVEEFERATDRAIGKLPKRTEREDSSSGVKRPPVGTGKTHSPTGKAAPPATHTAAGPAPGVTSPSLSGPSNPAAAEAIKALIAAQKQPGQPVAFLPPQQQPGAVSPAPAAARRPGDDDKDHALNARDLGLDSAPVVAPVSMPATAIPSPAATKMSAPTPATSGTSINDLHTATDVSGRSEPQQVRLSAGTATNATGTAASTNLANAAGQPALTPGMVPPLAGTPGGSGSRNGQKIVQHARSAEEAELQGINTIGEAVRGGTILQRRYDDGTGS
jgi:hypothetical protein